MFLAWKKSENDSKQRVQNHKKTLPGHPTSASRKKHVASKKLKNPRFFHFFSGWGLAGGFTNKSIPYCFLQCFVKASVTTYQKQEILSKKTPPPQVNLNLSWLMPSGWSRPLHRPVRGGIYLASPAENFINAQLIQLSSKRSMIDSRLGWLGAAWGSPLLHSLLFLQRDERGHAPRPQNGSRRKEVKESEVWTRAESPWWTIFIYMINIHYDIIWYNTIW